MGLQVKWPRVTVASGECEASGGKAGGGEPEPEGNFITERG